MNWLRHFPKTAQAQSIDLTMAALSELKGTPMERSAASILRNMDSLFKTIPTFLTDQPVSTQITEEQISTLLYDTIKDDPQLTFSGWEEVWNFIDSNKIISDTDFIHKVLLESIDIDGLTFDGRTVLFNEQPIGAADLPQIQQQIIKAETEIRSCIGQMAAVSNIRTRNNVWERSELRDTYITSQLILENLEMARRGRGNSGWQGNLKTAFEKMPEFFSKYMKLISLDDSGLESAPPDLPTIFNPQKLFNLLKGTYISKAAQFFISQRPDLTGHLRVQAEEKHKQNEIDLYHYERREFDHQFGLHEGTRWLDILKQDFRTKPEDPRFHLSCKTLSEMATKLYSMQHVSGAKETAQAIAPFVVSAQMIAIQDENMTFALGNNLEFLPDKNIVKQGIQILQNAGLTVPEIFNSPNANNMLESHFMQIQDYFADLKRSIKQRISGYSKEEIEKMRELGVARKVPEMNYSVLEQKYPGGGFSGVQGFGNNQFPKFIITFAPTPDFLVEKGIPKALLEEFAGAPYGHVIPRIHDMPAIGWVGGFVNPAEKSMFVFELQSDLMQNTSNMRDPHKMEQERRTRRDTLGKERAELQRQINEIMHQGTQPQKKDPRAGLKKKISDIQKDIVKVQEELSQMNSQVQAIESTPGFDTENPAFAQHAHLKQQIDAKLKKLHQFNELKAKMEDNLSKIKDPEQTETPSVQAPSPEEGTPTTESPIDAQSQQKIDKIKHRISLIDNEIEQSEEPINSRYEHPKWHDYRNLLENTFQDWIKIFWNTVVREAIKNNMNYLYVITAKDLKEKIWPNYQRAGGDTLGLFQRVYDGYGKDFYNGHPAQYGRFDFWKIDLRSPELKYASLNWFDKALGNLSKFNYLVPIVQPVSELRDGWITTMYFPEPTNQTPANPAI